MLVVILAHLMLASTGQQQCTDGLVYIGNECVENDIEPLSSFMDYKHDNKDFHLNFQFEYPRQNAEQFIVMMIQIKNAQWFAFGLGTKVIGSDFWQFSVNESQVLTFQDSFGINNTVLSNSNNTLSSDIVLGGSNNLIILGYQLSINSITTVKFKRLLNTNDIFDQVIEQQKQHAFIACGPSEPETNFEGNIFHKFQFPFVQGAESHQGQNGHWWLYHVIINFICWGILVDLGIIIARYLKTYSWYLLFHSILMMVIIFTSLIVEILMIIQNKSVYKYAEFNYINGYSKAHLVLGTIITLMIIMQLLTGNILRIQILSKSNFFKFIRELKRFHMFSGMIIYILAKFQLVVAAQISWAGTSWETLTIYTVFGFSFLWLSLWETYFKYYGLLFSKILDLKKSKTQSISSEWQYSSTTFMIQHIAQLDFQAISQEFPGKKWAIFNNSVIDLSDHIHPGGQYLWEQIQGREISRFIYGAYALEQTQNKAHQHSQYAIQLIEKLTIGSLMIVPLFSEIQQGFQTWNIQSQENLTPSTKLFGFTRLGVSFSTTLNGFENFGRYFLVRSETNKKISTRPYTMVLCMAKCNQEFRKQMIRRAVRRLDSDSKSTFEVDRRSNFQECNDELPLIIKKYKSKNGFSQYIHSATFDDQIQLCGPFGTSFGIRHQEQGQIVIIAGGTGILPFLDLLDFWLKKTLYKLLKPFGLESEVNPTKIDFDKYFQNDNKFVLLLAVSNFSELIGSDIYLNLARVQKYLPQPNFQLIINFGDNSMIAGNECVGQQRFCHSFIQKNIPDLMKVQRFLICGTPSMNRCIPQGLETLGVSKKKIYLV